MSAMKELYTELEATGGFWPSDWQTFPIYEWTPNGCACRRKCSSPGKHPRTRHGLKDATNNPAQHARWREYAPYASWAVGTGPESNLVVIDVDADKDGLETWALITNAYGNPETVTAQTGGGGLHLYFQYPADATVRNGVNKVEHGIDVRGLGGYVLLPGSTHRKGRYEWLQSPLDVEVSKLPEWLLDVVGSDE